MSGSMRLSLRPGEKIYINGAVLRSDRKVALELMNNATFLLESHVIQAAEANTPLRQLYFVVQTMLIDPEGAAAARRMFAGMISPLRKAFLNAEVLTGLEAVERLVAADRGFEALKAIRGLFPVEAAILSGEAVERTQAA
jgi:flagellar protein FlbT